MYSLFAGVDYFVTKNKAITVQEGGENKLLLSLNNSSSIHVKYN